jgi:hypothetical protein
VLDGECPVEDAESLLQLVQAQPEGPVDWSGCTRLHTAVLQVLAAAAAPVRGECGDAFVARWCGVDPSGGPGIGNAVARPRFHRAAQLNAETPRRFHLTLGPGKDS